MNKQLKNIKGFTLFEILVVLAIAGMLLAVILPSAWRARHDANYALIRQTAVELGKWGHEWTERNLAAQEVSDTCNADNYFNTLVGFTGGLDENGAVNNWFGSGNTMTPDCRVQGTLNKISFRVAEIMPQEDYPRNPFTGNVYFHSVHDGRNAMPGLLYNAVLQDAEGFNNYYFLYTASDAASATDWHAGMGNGLPPTFAGLRNGVFVARLKP